MSGLNRLLNKPRGQLADAIRSVFLKINNIVSIMDADNGDTLVRMEDGREFSIKSQNAVECWTEISDKINPYADGIPMPASRDPFIEFLLK